MLSNNKMNRLDENKNTPKDKDKDKDKTKSECKDETNLYWYILMKRWKL